MNKLWKFLDYYRSRALKIWWPVVFFIIPNLDEWILKASSTFVQNPKHLDFIEKTLNWLDPWWKWIVVIVIWFVHTKIIYELWSENISKPFPTGLGDSYGNIVKKVEKLIPEKSGEFKEIFSDGYRCLKDSSDIKTAIPIHLNAYRIIRDFLIEYFSGVNAGVQISLEMSNIRTNFENNFSELEKHNDKIERNDNLLINKQKEK